MQLPLLALTTSLLATSCTSSPPRPPCNPSAQPGQLGTICGFHRPEDVEAVGPAGILLASEMAPLLGSGDPGQISAIDLGEMSRGTPTPGRLWPPPADDTPANTTGTAPTTAPLGTPTCTTPPPAARFAPHGITTMRLPDSPDGTPHFRVAVVAHGDREAIELFDLTGHGANARLTWRGCVPFPANMAGNDVAFGPAGEIVAVNCLPKFGGFTGLWHAVRGNLGRITGSVQVWSRDKGWREVPDSAAAMPNGVAVSPDGEWIFVAETGSHRIARLPHPDSTHGGPPIRADVPGNPDNLSWSPRGTLLLATHTGGSSFAACAFGRLPCRSPWSLLEIDPTTLTVRERVANDGDALGAVSGASELDGVTYLGAVFDDRIGVLR